MNRDNALEYIKSGLGIAPQKRLFRLLSCGPLFMAITMGLFPGVALKGFHLAISVIMICMCLVALIMVFIRSNQELSVKNRLILQSIIYVAYIFELLLLELQWFLFAYPLNVFLFILYVPPILIPVLLGIKAAKKIRKDTPFRSKEIIHSGLRVSGIMAGLAGMAFAATFLRDVSQETVLIIIVVGLSIVSSIFSVGFLSIQRLYYWYKLQKLGSLPEEYGDPIKSRSENSSSIYSGRPPVNNNVKKKKRNLVTKIIVVLAVVIILFLLLCFVIGLLLEKGVIS